MILKTLKIGTRGSPLALAQTAEVAKLLKDTYPDLSLTRVIIKTSGDWKPEDGETKLSEAEGGKGLFAREIENALLEGKIDCAVHSLKDMASVLPDGLALDHVLKRADVRDAFISHKAQTLADLSKGAKVGTSSMRRQSFVLAQRSDLNVVPIRGNVQTRLDKLAAGQFDATYLAMAGLGRLSISGDFIHPVEVGDMVPACGQGIIAVETREDAAEVRILLDAIHHKKTGLCAFVERAALRVLDGSCHTPIGAHARFKEGKLHFNLVLSSLDGKEVYEEAVQTNITTRAEAANLGAVTAKKIKVTAPKSLFT